MDVWNWRFNLNGFSLLLWVPFRRFMMNEDRLIAKDKIHSFDFDSSLFGHVNDVVDMEFPHTVESIVCWKLLLTLFDNVENFFDDKLDWQQQ